MVELSGMSGSLRFSKYSVKVVGHRNGESFCRRLWKRVVGAEVGSAVHCVAVIRRDGALADRNAMLAVAGRNNSRERNCRFRRSMQ